MVEGLLLKMFGAFFYLVIAGWGLYGMKGLIREFRAAGDTALKTQVTVLQLQKMIAIREKEKFC
ncbi:MAG: hypothetical protein HZB33_11840 [Nitrospirae bacterium]|nr:hypothetical protein [Nitrospirota bacterium]